MTDKKGKTGPKGLFKNKMPEIDLSSNETRMKLGSWLNDQLESGSVKRVDTGTSPIGSLGLYLVDGEPLVIYDKFYKTESGWQKLRKMACSERIAQVLAQTKIYIEGAQITLI